MQAPSSAAARRRQDQDLDVDAELAQLLKEQDAFMRQNKAPAAKIVRVSRPPASGDDNDSSDELPPLEATDADAPRDDAGDDEPAQGPQVVGSVRERDVITLNETNRRVMPHCEAGGFPAVKRRGESLFGRRRRQQPDTSGMGQRDPSTMLSGMGRIVEKAPSVVQAKASAAAPAPDGVSDSEWAEIDASNTAALQAMSTQEIREAQEELLRSLDPELIAKLRNRRHRSAAPTSSNPIATEAPQPTTAQKQRPTATADVMDLASIRDEEELFDRAKALPAEERAKHEWMQPVACSDAKHDAQRQRMKGLPVKSSSKVKATTERFDFNGDVTKMATGGEKISVAPAHSGLYHHGDDPDAPGYTMDELLHLARSTVASQRAMALVTISKILNKRKSQAGDLVPAVLPPQLPIALRMALDDQNYTALSAAISALHAFLVSASTKNDEDAFEGAFGAIVQPPQIHLHVNEGTKPDELLHEVIYIDTSESSEDGSVIGDEELTSLDPIQGYLKMDIVTRLGYIVSNIQLPDEDSMEKILDILYCIAAHSPRATTSIAANRSLLKTLQSRYVENERILTLQVEQQDLFTHAVRLAIKTLRVVRVLCQGDRAAATSMIESGLIQSTKGFIALRGDGTQHLEGVQLECLRIWRTLLMYGLDYHCFAYLYPILCGFDGVGLVQEQRSGIKAWPDSFEHLEKKSDSADEKKSDSNPAPLSFASDVDVVSSFVERIVQEFMASSFGNAHFARTVTLFLLHDFPLSIRKWVWKELMGSHMLHHLAPFSSDLWLATGRRCTHDAKKSDEALIQLLKQVVTSKQYSSDEASFVFWLAIHHIVAYLFGDDSAAGEFSFSRRSLLQELAKQTTPAVWTIIVSYDVAHFPSTSSSMAPSSLSGKHHRVERIRTHGATMSSPVDLVIYARHVIPVVPTNVVLADHAVVVRDSRIIDLLPRADVAAKYAPREERDLRDHILIPGFVNGHSHAAMNLLRGLSDDKPLCDWLMQDIWPAEGKFVSPEFVQDGVTHAAAEMLRSGTTCCNDMYFFPGDAAEALEQIGLRAVLGQVVFEFPTSYGSGPDDYFAKARAGIAKFKDHPTIRVAVAPHAPYTVSEANLVKVDALSREHNVPIHIHLHETAAECEDSEHQNKTSMNCHLSDERLRPLANLQRLGLLSDRVIAVHMTQLTDDEIAHVAAAGTSVVHCPSSNLKLASGVCPVTKLVAAGVNVAIGTDGAASNNSLNMFNEMKLAAILAKAESKQSTSVPAAMALQMATLNGARALGLGAEIGSIEVGKRADLVAIACDDIEMIPMYDAISHVVYVAGRENVSDVWVNGKHVLASRQLTTVSEADVKRRVHQWHGAIRDFHNELQQKKLAN
ncbi:hypothetical protein P43SY_007363 [Pythium insidiosum]|uniref:Amidohydrolase-related domain-containing protein n=1 Tax=Pythium insidiosum TaxID=114742 RepID=A0AAD5QBK5_PYTIN|nr:hypothetical protein P43SY_007363 [Pythium insidiosum]